MDCQRDQALPTALAPKLSLDRNLVQEGFDRERGMRITHKIPELDGFWDAKEKSARFRS